MENQTKEEIAIELGLDPTTVVIRNTQNWIADTHPHITLSELVTDQGVFVFRSVNRKTGETVTKLSKDPYIMDGKKVDDEFNAVMEIQMLKNSKLVPAVNSVFPELSGGEVVQLQASDGSLKLADVVGGQLTNIRPSPELPKVSWTEETGFIVDASKMSADKQAEIDAAVKQVDNEGVVTVILSDSAIRVVTP